MGFPISGIVEDYITFTFTDDAAVQQGEVSFSNFEIPSGIIESEMVTFGTFDSYNGFGYQTRTLRPRQFAFTVRTGKRETFGKLLLLFQLLAIDYTVKFTFPYYQIFQPVTQDIQFLSKTLNESVIDVDSRYRDQLAAIGLRVDVAVPFIVKSTQSITVPSGTEIIDEDEGGAIIEPVL